MQGRCDQSRSSMCMRTSLFSLRGATRNLATPTIQQQTKPHLLVVAVAGVVLWFARTHPIVSVAQASTGAILGLLRAGSVLHLQDGNARLYSRRGVGQPSNAGEEQRQITKVLKKLDRPRVPGGSAGLLAVRSACSRYVLLTISVDTSKRRESWSKG